MLDHLSFIIAVVVVFVYLLILFFLPLVVSGLFVVATVAACL